jgi:hypothetical protein
LNHIAPDRAIPSVPGAVPLGRLQMLRKANVAFSPSPARSLGQLQNILGLRSKQLLGYSSQFALYQRLNPGAVFSIRMRILAAFDSVMGIRILFLLLRCFGPGHAWNNLNPA